MSHRNTIDNFNKNYSHLNVKVVLSDEHDFDCFSNIIRQFKLFEGTGEISFLLNDIDLKIIPLNLCKIAIATINDVPIGTALKARNRILCFVNPEYRLNNIGTLLALKIKDSTNDFLYATEGRYNNSKFWENLYIPVI